MGCSLCATATMFYYTTLYCCFTKQMLVLFHLFFLFHTGRCWRKFFYTLCNQCSNGLAVLSS